MERSGSSLRARRAARRWRKPTCCRSNSFQNGGFVFSLAPCTEGTREQAFGRSRGGFSCKVHCLSDARGSSSTSRPARQRTAWHSKRSPAWPRRGPPLIRPALGSRLVQGHGGANESLQRPLVYLLALVEVDGAPCVPVKAGVEESRRILQSRSLGEGHLHDVLVSLACADQSVVRPHRNPSPLPLLDDFGIGFLD